MNASRYPYRFDRSARVAELHERFHSLAAGQESGERVSVAGRIRSHRSHGKVAFADLEDGTGRVQLFAQQDVLGDEGMAEFLGLGVGDIVGAEGEVVRTRRGELSVRVSRAVLLAECLRPLPEKWHGMSDVEARHRRRYLDLLANPLARRALEARATLNSAARTFLEAHGFVEVETPLLHPVAGGAVARPFKTHHNALDIDLYLRIAPELYLKRLLIAGFERVYELNRSFRNEGVSARHSPEYTMLEAYEAYVDYTDTMSLVEELVRAIAGAAGVTTFEARGEVIDLTGPFRRITMFEAIAEFAAIDLSTLWATGDDEGLGAAAASLGIEAAPSRGRGELINAIYEEMAENRIVEPTFVMGFPKEVSPLAKDHRSIPGFTEHSDLVVAGVELCTIFSELNDPIEQRRRFEQQAAARVSGDEESALPDEDFLEALSYGMPPAGGFGLGMDRLLMLLLELPSLREVILFPTLRPEP